MNERRGGGDPLTAMYFVAAVLMAIASLTIVLLMFVPRDGSSPSDPEDLWVPGALPAYDMPQPAGAPAADGPSPEQEAELHLH